MTDDRVNIKVPPDVHAELKAAKDMDWPDQLLHWKRRSETTEELEPLIMGVGERYHELSDRLDDLEAQLPRKVAEELGR